MVIDSLCVFCGASPGNKAIYMDAATSFGTELAQHGIHLVYGGGGSGLMGCVADSALKAGGEVTGVIPNYLKDRELGHQKLTNLEKLPPTGFEISCFPFKIKNASITLFKKENDTFTLDTFNRSLIPRYLETYI